MCITNSQWLSLLCLFSRGCIRSTKTLLCVPSHSVNISTLGWNFLSISKPWLSITGFPDFMLALLSLFLYLITWDNVSNFVGLLLSFKKYIYLFSHSSQLYKLTTIAGLMWKQNTGNGFISAKFTLWIWIWQLILY
jgi:hypothetical protein